MDLKKLIKKLSKNQKIINSPGAIQISPKGTGSQKIVNSPGAKQIVRTI
jgi:hypothetical protein